MTDSIIVAVSFDKGYAEQATIMLYSLLSNNTGHRFKFFAFFNDLDEATKKRITFNLKQFSNFEIVWIKIEESLIKAFQSRRGHVNEYTYTRLYICEILPDLDRLIYLDCDMLVLHDISGLWEADLKGKTIAAVPDPSSFNRYKDLGIPEGRKYFNAGMLVLDVKQWNKNTYTKIIVNKLVALGGLAAERDQDGLNAILYNDWLELDQKWNTQSHHVAEAQESRIKNIKSHLSPYIIHFTGNLKPWNFKSSNPYKVDYYAILRQTDFSKTHRPQNKTAINIARRAARNVLVSMGILKY